ncbi:hypothetical protein [Xenorhabdus bovienii]|uniref:hypothetical protein n=1 Tax=Xenorhabdus bovienii TaxID=40576 RepID=UPI0023B34EBA|nr:hypothetical protein [Xenorhabdus bovienii]MDE9429907.1 hypothetical protein [Xenorhabdus bovienii]
MQYLDTLLYDVKRRIAEAQKIVQKRRRSDRGNDILFFTIDRMGCTNYSCGHNST